MRICNGLKGIEWHDEIVHEGGGCPLCATLTDMETWKNKLKEEIDVLKDDIQELKAEQEAK